MMIYSRITKIKNKFGYISINSRLNKIKNSSLRYTILSKRLLFNRRGYTVHSPFIYSFIHKIIKNKKPYYCFSSLKKETKDIRKNLSKDKNSKTIYYRSVLELIFRIVDNTSIKDILVANNEKSIVPLYLKHLKTNIIQIDDNTTLLEYKQRIQCKQSLLIFENISDNIVTEILNYVVENKIKAIVIFLLENKSIKSLIQSITNNQYSSIEINKIEIAFINYNITIDKAKVYYK